jgi:penicillin amidase
MIKIVRRLLISTGLLIVFAAVAVWLSLRASLPELEGEISVSSLAEVATIERDATGIPVITASNRIDLAFATGLCRGRSGSRTGVRTGIPATIC